MRVSIKVRRAPKRPPVPMSLDELCVRALSSVPEVRSAYVDRMDCNGIVIAFEWSGVGPPRIDEAALLRFGLAYADAE